MTIKLTREQFNDAVDTAFYRRQEREVREREQSSELTHLRNEAMFRLNTVEPEERDMLMSLIALQLSRGNEILRVELYNHMFCSVYNIPEVKDGDSEV